MPISLSEPQLLDENFEQEFKALGQRLAGLLAAADLPQEVKEAWAALVPEMSLEQVDKLMVILERYVNSTLSKEFADFKNDVARIQKAYEDRVKQSEDSAMSQLDDLEKMMSEG